MAQVGQLGGSRLVLFCIHRVNWVNSHMTASHDGSTINIVLQQSTNMITITESLTTGFVFVVDDQLWKRIKLLTV